MACLLWPGVGAALKRAEIKYVHPHTHTTVGVLQNKRTCTCTITLEGLVASLDFNRWHISSGVFNQLHLEMPKSTWRADRFFFW